MNITDVPLERHQVSENAVACMQVGRRPRLLCVLFC